MLVQKSIAIFVKSKKRCYFATQRIKENYFRQSENIKESYFASAKKENYFRQSEKIQVGGFFEGFIEGTSQN